MNKDLKKYAEKRDPDVTPEPGGDDAPHINEDDHVFVIQKHDAQNLHYDFRLNIDGTLVSWAVPKGLSTEANNKRLAIRTEDHPLDYAEFEGVIPDDQYGGGTVMIWDKGAYSPLAHNDDEDGEKDGEKDKTMREALDDGALKFALNGEKLKGGYAMARIQDDDEDEQWVIFKLDDEHADARRNPVSTEPESVKTGRSMDEIEVDEK